MKWLFVTVLIFTQSTGMADTLASSDQVHQLTEKIMATVSTGNVREGLAMLKLYSNIPEVQQDADMGQFASKFPMVVERFGKSLGYEFVRTDKIGGFLQQATYVHKFEKNVMRWRMMFYNNGKGWKCIGWDIDDATPAFFPK